jgi:hypothetical protein
MTADYLDSPQLFDRGGFALLGGMARDVIEFRKIEIKQLPRAPDGDPKPASEQMQPTKATSAPSAPVNLAAIRVADRDRGTSVRASVDPADFPAIVGEVAPRFSLRDPVAPAGIAIVAMHFGRQRVLCTHPPDRERPCVLTATVDLPPNKSSRLLLDVSHHPRGDWRLFVTANGQQLYDGIVKPGTTKNGWLTLFAGKQVALELHNKATGWQFEWGYWGKVQIVSE